MFNALAFNFLISFICFMFKFLDPDLPPMKLAEGRFGTVLDTPRCAARLLQPTWTVAFPAASPMWRVWVLAPLPARPSHTPLRYTVVGPVWQP